MCNKKLCICQTTDPVTLERVFLRLWQRNFTLREEAQIEIQEKDRLR